MMNGPEPKRLRFDESSAYGITNPTSPDYQNSGAYEHAPPIGEANYSSTILSQEDEHICNIAKTKQLLKLKENYIVFLEFLHEKIPDVKMTDTRTGKPFYPSWFVSINAWATKCVEELDTETYGYLKQIYSVAAMKDANIRNSSSPTQLITIRTPLQNPPSTGTKGKRPHTTPLRNPNFEIECPLNPEWETEGIKDIMARIDSEELSSDKMNDMKKVVKDLIYMLVSLRAACKEKDPNLLRNTTPIRPRNSEVHAKLGSLATEVFDAHKKIEDKK